jgi:hypothetical protein
VTVLLRAMRCEMLFWPSGTMLRCRVQSRGLHGISESIFEYTTVISWTKTFSTRSRIRLSLPSSGRRRDSRRVQRPIELRSYQIDETKERPLPGRSPIIAVPCRLDLTDEQVKTILG